MSTLAEIRTDVRAHVDETTERFFTDDELDVWIYEAARDIARRAEVLSDTHTITLKADIDRYDLPADILRIHRVEYLQDGETQRHPLEYRPILEMDDRRVSGFGYGRDSYSIWGWAGDSQQLIYSASTTGDKLVVYYYRLPKRPTDDEQAVEVPAGWQDLIPLYAETVARRKDNDSRWKDSHDLYEARLAQMLQTTRHLTDQGHFMSADGVGVFGGWDDW